MTQIDTTVATGSGSHLAAAVTDDLIAALVNARIHSGDHPRVTDSVNRVIRRAGEFFAETRKPEIALTTTSQFVVFEDRPLLRSSFAATRLIQSLDRWNAGGLRIAAGASAADVMAMLRQINRRPRQNEDFTLCNSELALTAGGRVALLPRHTPTAADSAKNATTSICSVPIHLYQSMMELLENITVQVSSGGFIDFEPVKEHAVSMLRHLEGGGSSLLNMTLQDQYDAFTFGHSVRVSVLAMNFGRALTSNKGFLQQLGTAALLHDVGKSRVPFEILHSTRALTLDERREMSQHPVYGSEILLDHQHVDPHSVAACFGHHCSHDRRGYPRTVHEHEVSMVTEIVGIADVYEALTAARPYKRAMPPVRAYRIMMGMKNKFDPALLRKFIEANGVYPSGQLIELTNGALARVEEQTGDLQKPRIRVFTDIEKHPISPARQRTVDLSAESEAANITIARVLNDDLDTLARLS